MRQSSNAISLFNGVALKTAAFTAATTDICTSNSHGLVDGDRVILTTTTTLPAGLAVNTVYTVLKINANTFYLSAEEYPTDNGTKVNITDTGTGTHTFTVCLSSKAVLATDYRHKDLTLATAGMGAGDTITVKVQGSGAVAVPNFHLTKSATNDWDYIQIIDSEDGSSIDGDTGVTFSDANDVRKFAINADGYTWIALQITTQSDVTNTTLTATINLYND